MAALELRFSDLFYDANLKAYYRLNAGALTTDSKASFTLTNVNSVAETTGNFNGGADFGSANTDKRLYVANDLGITGGAISIAFWVKLNAEIASDATVWILASQQDAGNSVANWVQYEYNGGTRRLFFTRVRQGTSFDGAYYNITLGTTDWYFIVITYDGTNIKGYVNGSSVITPTASSGNGSGSTLDFISLASDGNNSGQSFASIKLDDVAFFNRALTATEISDHYNGLDASTTTSTSTSTSTTTTSSSTSSTTSSTSTSSSTSSTSSSTSTSTSTSSSTSTSTSTSSTTTINPIELENPPQIPLIMGEIKKEQMFGEIYDKS